jgi:hypothetical protein
VYDPIEVITVRSFQFSVFSFRQGTQATSRLPH